MSEKNYEGSVKILLGSVTYDGQVLAPKIFIYSMDWETFDIAGLEVVDFKTRRKGIKDIASERMEFWKASLPHLSIHRVWNTDMHICNNRRILV